MNVAPQFGQAIIRSCVCERMCSIKRPVFSYTLSHPIHSHFNCWSSFGSCLRRIDASNFTCACKWWIKSYNCRKQLSLQSLHKHIQSTGTSGMMFRRLESRTQGGTVLRRSRASPIDFKCEWYRWWRACRRNSDSSTASNEHKSQQHWYISPFPELGKRSLMWCDWTCSRISTKVSKIWLHRCHSHTKLTFVLVGFVRGSKFCVFCT